MPTPTRWTATMNKCPKCGEPMQRGATECLFCPWSSKGVKHDNRKDYDSLAPCYKCAGTGIVSKGHTGYASCVCERGKWMRDFGDVFKDLPADMRDQNEPPSGPGLRAV